MIIALLFVVSNWIHSLYIILWIICSLLCIVLIYDIFILFYPKKGISATRVLSEKFSNGDHNTVRILIQNYYNTSIDTEIIDEIPIQFQKRDFLKKIHIQETTEHAFDYTIRPVKRGEYHFGYLHIYAQTRIGLVKRKYSFDKAAKVSVYPSFIQMKKYDFLAINQKLSKHGLKKIRRIGHTMEFEQIKEYINGDDVRTLNWKATAKQGRLMVNQFQDEKSQPIYSLIDISRAMKMPFNDLSLLDYAINSTLAFSNIALKKNDQVGMLTFGNKISNYLPNSRKKTYINTISEKLYKINTQFLDADFGLLYAHIKRKITHRSLILLYTNFEHISALRRQLPYLKMISKKHTLVVIFFENTELTNATKQEAQKIEKVYFNTIAQQFVNDKKLMKKELQKHGIQVILTKPEELSVNTINKYLEIKARGML